MNIKIYKDMIVWQKSMDLAIEIYKLVKLLPKEEIYALADQRKVNQEIRQKNLSSF